MYNGLEGEVRGLNTVKEYAYAKVNLYLDVVGRRPDGFHDIKTVMQSVALADVLTVSESAAPAPSVALTLKGNARLPTDTQNLAVKAAYAYMKHAGLSRRIHITLDKKIPIGAGLGGGSSDAAATLRAMNRLFGKMLSERVLLELAASIGSDVPFCLLGGTALCEGRGERVMRLSLPRALYFVIGSSGEHISTPTAYAALDGIYSFFDGSVPFGKTHLCDALSRFLKDDGDLPTLYNIFEEAILPECPSAAAIREKLLTLGAISALMSGSGPSVFGIFEDEISAKNAADALNALGYRATFAKSV